MIRYSSVVMCTSSRVAQDPLSLTVEYKQLLTPPLEDVAEVLQNGLSSYFERVSVSVVQCPDLTAQPYCLASKGLCGSPQVVEVGGVSNFMPLPNMDKVYDMKHLNRLLGVDPAVVLGTGAAPGHQCSELIANAKVSNGDVHSLNRIAKVTDGNENGYLVQFLPRDETTFILMANFYVSKGEPGKVLKIDCQKRIGTEDFPAAIRKCLSEKFKQHIGLGGVFLVEGSQVRQHIPPADFSTDPIMTPQQLNSWLRFFDMNSPLTFLGTILTHHMDMEMILQHFHSFSSDGGREGGHYHYDVSPQTVRYQAYFCLAERAVHIDRPPRKSDLNVDDIDPA